MLWCMTAVGMFWYYIHCIAISNNFAICLWWTCLLYCACHAKCIFVDPLQNVPRRPTLLKLLENFHVLLTVHKVQNPLRLPRKTTSESQKVVRTCGAFDMLTSKCASRHNGTHFFDISTSKSGPNMRCLAHFDFDMCFAPQPRAIVYLSSGQMAPHPPLTHRVS